MPLKVGIPFEVTVLRFDRHLFVPHYSRELPVTYYLFRTAHDMDLKQGFPTGGKFPLGEICEVHVVRNKKVLKKFSSIILFKIFTLFTLSVYPINLYWPIFDRILENTIEPAILCM